MIPAVARDLKFFFKLLGYLFNWGLYGILSCQVCPYQYFFQAQSFSENPTDIFYLVFPNDRRHVKLLVYGIYLMETIQTILITREAFDDYAQGFGNLDALDAQGLKPIAVPIFTGLGRFAAGLILLIDITSRQ